MSLEYPNEGCGDNGDNGGTLNIPMVSPSQNPFQLDGVNGSEATTLTSLSVVISSTGGGSAAKIIKIGEEAVHGSKVSQEVLPNEFQC
ncbi:hypothetical protein NC651_000805 [Populus alba x Populus x berolinensis]|nr:hypothetical protein NC651_000805 [Populus alba x Populus x berolinensis]